ncbi:LOW QUALITY PROTEIN: olfactory receptor 4C5-like [Marmota marmota marmota]|uniref:LOW QUALITY PROTEIN: olfactory receptor 4C5-like n=1 Tax=Marmota marmota marmota TaxID=9994 RepID=UPI0020921DFD|nr:LOW QUALITY PROTEIN: olfactory receptor 4C5-like [Marmota marmota marmota]
MGQANNVTESILLGLMQDPHMQKFLFVIFLLSASHPDSQPIQPRAPPYSFLSFIDGYCSPTMTPKMIFDLLAEKNKTISFSGCMTQLFAEHFFGGVEIIVLTVMTNDCYVAICKPLHYMITMNRQVCGLQVSVAWAGGFLHGLIQTIFIICLSFCGPNVTDHFTCDLFSLLKLSHLGLLVAANSRLMCILIFYILIISYVLILCSLETHSAEEQRRALSTCASHVAVVVLFFVPCVF